LKKATFWRGEDGVRKARVVVLGKAKVKSSLLLKLGIQITYFARRLKLQSRGLSLDFRIPYHCQFDG
jgi:hypothetical protein